MKIGVICLGRHGDVANSLPIAWWLYQQGDKPTFVTAPEWASTLEGVSYADSLVWDGPYSNPTGALKWCESLRRFDRLMVPQCYGQSFVKKCDSFCEEAWRLVGMQEAFGKLPLVFDRRNPEREAVIIPKFTKPIVLVCTSGISSPFDHADLLWETLKPLRENYDLVDLSLVKAHRFYDLLGLYEKAAWLVAIDSGPLHLAQAVPSLPVVAIVTDHPTPWYGSPARPNHRLRIRYGDFVGRVNEIPDAIVSEPNLTMKMIHVWSDYPRLNPDAARRHAVAKKTWETEFNGGLWVEMPVPETVFPRNARYNFGEKKAAPFFGDLLDRAARRAKDNDVLVFTNDDTCLVPGAGRVLESEVPKCGAVFCSRVDHTRFDQPLSVQDALTGQHHVGADIFAFTVEWWKRWRGDMPDMLIAFEAFDLVLRKLITMHGGKELLNCCYHEQHLGDWTRNRMTRGAVYNRSTAGKWLAAHGVKWGHAFAANIKPRVWPKP